MVRYDSNDNAIPENDDETDANAHSSVVLPFLHVVNTRHEQDDIEAGQIENNSSLSRHFYFRECVTLALGVVSILSVLIYMILEHENLDTILSNVTFLNKFFRKPSNCSNNMLTPTHSNQCNTTNESDSMLNFIQALSNMTVYYLKTHNI